MGYLLAVRFAAVLRTAFLTVRFAAVLRAGAFLAAFFATATGASRIIELCIPSKVLQ